MPYRLLLGLRGYQEKPPSTRSIEPVVKLDASEAKNNAAPMISVDHRRAATTGC